jgi:hypothetical protein
MNRSSPKKNRFYTFMGFKTSEEEEEKEKVVAAGILLFAC